MHGRFYADGQGLVVSHLKHHSSFSRESATRVIAGSPSRLDRPFFWTDGIYLLPLHSTHVCSDDPGHTLHCPISSAAGCPRLVPISSFTFIPMISGFMTPRLSTSPISHRPKSPTFSRSTSSTSGRSTSQNFPTLPNHPVRSQIRRLISKMVTLIIMGPSRPGPHLYRGSDISTDLHLIGCYSSFNLCTVSERPIGDQEGIC